MEHSAFPDTFCARMKRLLGEDYPDFLAAMEKERSYGLRVSPLKTSPAAFAARSWLALKCETHGLICRGWSLLI